LGKLRLVQVIKQDEELFRNLNERSEVE